MDAYLRADAGGLAKSLARDVRRLIEACEQGWAALMQADFEESLRRQDDDMQRVRLCKRWMKVIREVKALDED